MLAKRIQTARAGRPFDLSSADDTKELKTWCRLHFRDIISKGLEPGGLSIYHDCCISFCKRGCLKKYSHPQVQSVSIKKIPSLYQAESPDDLYEWIRSRMLVHYKLGKKVHFPSINTAHFDNEVEHTDDEGSESVELLGKRLKEMEEQKLKTEQQLSELKEENKRLVSSTKSWYNKYQELLTRFEGEKLSFTEITPKKHFISKETLTNDIFFDL